MNEAIQVVYEFNEQTQKREVTALLECAKEIKPAKLTILTKNHLETKTTQGVKIKFTPLMDWLME